MSRSFGSNPAARPCQPPEQRGFGSIVIERNLAETLEADVHLAFEPEGIQCRIVIPAACWSSAAHPACIDPSS